MQKNAHVSALSRKLSENTIRKPKAETQTWYYKFDTMMKRGMKAQSKLTLKCLK